MTQSPQFLPKLSEVTSEQKDVLILSLLKRIAELERRLGLNSQNSHKLPSSDGLARAPQSLLHTSNLPVGRQVGHSGKTLKKSSPIEHVVVHPLAQHCHVSGADLGILPQQEAKERRQVIDLPALRFEVKAHRILASRCTYGEDHQSNFPPELVSAVQYGAQIRATALYLHYYQTALCPYHANASGLIWCDYLTQHPSQYRAPNGTIFAASSTMYSRCLARRGGRACRSNWPTLRRSPALGASGE